MDDLKESKQAVGAEVLTSMQQFAPPTILAQASRLNFSTRLFNLLVTNVPGPQFPLYVQGREMTSVFPIAFLPKDHALAIAIMSYNGQMNFGLLGDYDAMPDLNAVRRGDRVRARPSSSSLAARDARKRAKATPRPDAGHGCATSALARRGRRASTGRAWPARPRGCPPCRSRSCSSGSASRA